MNFVRLPLKGAVNTRELGGYYTKDNKVTKFNTYIRSNRLTEITDEDNIFLKNYGVTDIIDLRGNTKVQDTFVSDDNINRDYFTFHYIPLSNEKIEKYSIEYSELSSFNYGYGYSYLLENKEKVKQIFEVLIHSNGAVLFHCSAGKDRTGVVAALILGVCGVDEKDIVANYEVTSTYMQDEEIMKKYNENLRKSDGKFMQTFIDILKKKYGSFENYILGCGITKEEIESLKRKFCEEY